MPHALRDRGSLRRLGADSQGAEQASGQQKLRAPQERRLSMYRKLNIPKFSARFPNYRIFVLGMQP